MSQRAVKRSLIGHWIGLAVAATAVCLVVCVALYGWFIFISWLIYRYIIRDGSELDGPIGWLELTLIATIFAVAGVLGGRAYFRMYAAQAGVVASLFALVPAAITAISVATSYFANL